MSVADMTCGFCERDSDVLVTCPTCKVAYCLDCYRSGHDRAALAFRDVYGPDFAELAVYQSEGR